MRVKTKTIIAAMPIVAVAAGVAVATRAYLRSRRRKEAAGLLTEDVFEALDELGSLKDEDFIPNRTGSSLYQHTLDSFTDRQLLGAYVLIKTAEALRSRGADLNQISKKELLNEMIEVRDVNRLKRDRRELLKQMELLVVKTFENTLAASLLLASNGA